MNEKETNRLHWMFKGSLLPPNLSKFELEQEYNRYFNKGWCIVDPDNSLEGFEEAWAKRIRPMTDDEKQPSIIRSKANRKD